MAPSKILAHGVDAFRYAQLTGLLLITYQNTLEVRVRSTENTTSKNGGDLFREDFTISTETFSIHYNSTTTYKILLYKRHSKIHGKIRQKWSENRAPTSSRLIREEETVPSISQFHCFSAMVLPVDQKLHH